MSKPQRRRLPSIASRSRLLPTLGAASLLGFAALSACGSGDPFSERAEGGGPAGTGGTGTAGNGAAGQGGSGARTSDGGRDATPGGGDSGGESAGAPSPPNAGAAGGSSELCAQGQADCNDDPQDGCETSLGTESDCGQCHGSCSDPMMPYCADTDDGYACVNPIQPLVDQRLEVPCLATPGSPVEVCETVVNGTAACPPDGAMTKRSFKMDGEAGTVYDVTLRIRGVLEAKIYENGQSAGDHFYVGGAPTMTNYNAYRLSVSTPAQTYFLNAESAMTETRYVFPLDHTKVISIAGGATVELAVTDADCLMVRNCESFASAACAPYVIDGLAPAPAGYNGQFVHIDVVGVAVAD